MKPPGIIFSDMSCCEPTSALSRERETGRWKLVDYETMDGIEGVMAFGVPGNDTPEIRLPINLNGPHRVFIGINYTRTNEGDHLHHSEWPLYGQLQLKLDGDVGFTRFALEYGWRGVNAPGRVGKDSEVYRSMQEAYWKTIDLTGVRHLAICTMGEPYVGEGVGKTANISYIRCEPLDQTGLATWNALQPTESTRNMALLWCSGMLSGHAMGNRAYHPVDSRWMSDELTPFVGNDIGMVVFEAIRGNLCCYRSEIGDIGSPDDRWHDEWIDPLADAVGFCREHDLKICASMRMMGPAYPMIDAPIGRARFFWAHPEWAKRTRDGMLCTNLSIAFPEVRRYWLSLLREVLDYGLDGVHLHFQRSQPFVMYEGPVVEEFQAKHGVDPREIDEDEPRLVQHKADYLTRFLREIRALVDEKPGRTVGITFYGEPHKYDPREGYHPLRYNCDVDRWIDEGLADILSPSPAIVPEALKAWKERAQGRIKFWVDLQPRNQEGHEFVDQARRYYEAGADGFTLWDGERRPPHASEWAVVRNLGHRDALDLLEGEAVGYYRRVHLKRLGPFYAPDSFHDG